MLPILLGIGLPGAAAQSQPRVAVTGVVRDPRGAPVAGATVTLEQEANAPLSQTRTDNTGRFRFDSVSQGSYSIEVRHDGFQPALKPLQVQARAPTPLTITLALALVVTNVTVIGNDSEQVSTDIAENRDAASVDKSLLESVPVFDQDVVTTMSQFLDQSAVGTSGVQTIVNGVEVSSVNVSTSAIQEVRINQNPYSAEYARPGRGGIEIITKEATSDYHGTFNFAFRDSALNARDPFALVRAPEQRRIFEGAIGGPVGQSKTTSFMISWHRLEEDLESIVFAEGLSGPIQESVPSPKRDTLLTLHLGHQFSENHSVFWQYNEWDYPSRNQGVGGFVLPEAGTNSDQWEREWTFNDRISVTPRLLFQFQILFGWEHHASTSLSSTPKIVVQDAFTSGSAQTDLVNNEHHVQLNAIGSWTSGKHLLKFGINVPDLSFRGLINHNNFGSTYYFSSLQDYHAQQPYAFRVQQGFGNVGFWQDEVAGFVQDEFRFRPNLSFTLGLRYNWQNFLHDYTQFAPRMAFAYSPDKKRKTVIRGGAGIFYDRTGPNPLGDLLLYQEGLRGYLLLNPTYPAALAPGDPADAVQFDPALREPYSIQYSLGVERQLAKKATLAVTYNGSQGYHLFLSRDINAPTAPPYLIPANPMFGVVRQIESAGRQSGNSLEVTIRGQLTRFATGLIQYTLSRTYNNTGGITWFPANQYDLSGEWARADFDQRHRLSVLESFTPGKQFTLGVGLFLATGKPYSLTTGDDFFGTGMLNARPPGVSRNTLDGPGYAEVDLRLSRDFYLRRDKKDKEKGMVATFGIEGFNLFNRVNYVAYVGNEQSRFFGQAVSAYPARRMQLVARLRF
jgi:hypothetical protein